VKNYKDFIEDADVRATPWLSQDKTTFVLFPSNCPASSSATRNRKILVCQPLLLFNTEEVLSTLSKLQ